eukprot:10988295-Alexandrium_andersonii.AAC.1
MVFQPGNCVELTRKPFKSEIREKPAKRDAEEVEADGSADAAGAASGNEEPQQALVSSPAPGTSIEARSGPLFQRAPVFAIRSDARCPTSSYTVRRCWLSAGGQRAR